MAKTIRLDLVADASKATKTINVTQAEINKLARTLANMGKLTDDSDVAAIEKYNKDLADMYVLIMRQVKAIHEANPAISESAALQQTLSKTTEAAGRAYKGLESSVMDYLKTNLGEASKKFAEEQEELREATEKAKKSMDDAKGGLSSYAVKLLETVKNIMTFRLGMGVTNNLVRGFKDLIKDSAKAAAEAEQVFSKLNTVFGETSGALNQTIELSGKLGVATSTAASALSTVGDLLQAQGQTTTESLFTATEWVKQFQDIIAFKDINMSLEEFAQNFMSGAAGNLRNFRTFGSIVKESAVNAELAKKNLDKLTGSELELAKMVTRAELALEQQSNAVGATSREWESVLSVNRRLDEAWKEYKENLGETVNKQLKPIKQWWTGILEEINKSNKAQELFNKGVKNINVYDLKNTQGEDYKNFSEAFKGSFTTGSGNKSSETAFIKSLEDAEKAVYKYGATLEDVKPILDELKKKNVSFGKTGETALDWVEDFEKRMKRITAERAAETKIQNMHKELVTLAETTDTFIESLAVLKATDIETTDFSTASQNWSAITEKGMQKVYDSNSANMAGQVQMAIDSAIESISKAGADKYTDALSVIFGDDAQLDALEEWKKEVEDLYTILYNEQIKNGNVSKAQLNTLKETWDEINKELDAHILKQQQIAAVNDAIANGVTGGSYTKQTAILTRTQEMKSRWDSDAMGFEGNDMYFNALAEIQMQYESLFSTVKEGTPEYKALQEALDKDTKSLRKYYKTLEEVNKAQEIANKIAETQTQGADYQTQREQLGMTDYEKQIVNFNKRLAEAVGNPELEKAIMAERIQYVALTSAMEEHNTQLAEQERITELSSSSMALLGEVGTFFNALGSVGDIMGGGGDLIMMLIELVAQTEAFLQVGSLLSDSILPTLNAFLEPLLPVIDLLSDAIQFLTVTVLAPAFPILKGIAYALSTVFGILNTVTGLISDSIKWTIGQIVKGFETIVNGIIDLINMIPFVDIGHVHLGASEWANIDVLGNAQKNWNSMTKSLEEISEMTMEIGGDTAKIAKEDYSAYKNLLLAGKITQDQYSDWTKTTRYSSTTLKNGVTYTTGDNRSYVNVNNLTVQVPEGMTFDQFIRNLDKREFLPYNTRVS